MRRDELVRYLVSIPAEADVVVEVNGLHLDIEQTSYRAERENIVLRLNDEDLKDSLHWSEQFGPMLHIRPIESGHPPA